MNKILLIIFTFHIFLLPLCFCYDLGIYPSKIEIQGTANMWNCSTFEIFGKEDWILQGETRFSKKESRNLADYSLMAKDRGCLVTFQSPTYPGKKEICIRCDNGGTYFAIIRYHLEGTDYGIGTWIHAEISGPRFMETLTGKTLQEIRKNNFDLWFIFVCLLVVCTIMLIELFKRK